MPAYRSCQAGVRFSKNARTPSLASSVVQSRVKASFVTEGRVG
jgi:hypothetical protein